MKLPSFLSLPTKPILNQWDRSSYSNEGRASHE
jgi:hypothetical protein